MQLSLSSVPSDAGASTASTATAAGDSRSSDPNAAAASVGFAQVLAGIAPAGAAAACGPAGATVAAAPASPGAAGDLAAHDFSAVPANPIAPTSPTADATSVTSAAAILLRAFLPGVAPTVMPVGRSNLGFAVGGKPPLRGANQKSLAETGDLQALAVAAGQIVGPPPTLVATASKGVADAGAKPGVVSGAGSPAIGLDQTGGRPTSGTIVRLDGTIDRVAGLTGNAGPQALISSVPAATPSVGTTGTPAGTLPDATSISAADPTRAVAPAPQLAAGALPQPDPAGSGLKTATVGEVPAESTAASAESTAANNAVPPPSPSVVSPKDLGSIAFGSSLTAAEKIAANPVLPTGALPTQSAGDTKSILASSHKGLAQAESDLGIAVAKHDATMPAGSTFVRSNVSEAPPVVAASSATETRSSTDAVPPPVALPSSAQRAVDAVLNATDRFAARDQHSVNLQFSVGGADLSVRVELRSGEVHTTFRTDSADLRAALSNEWNSVTSQSNADRSTRLAPPVFTTNEHSGSSTSFSGDGASRQRDPESRGGSGGPAAYGTPRRGAVTTNTTSNPSTAPVTRSVSSNSVHLHTLA